MMTNEDRGKCDSYAIPLTTETPSPLANNLHADSPHGKDQEATPWATRTESEDGMIGRLV